MGKDIQTGPIPKELDMRLKQRDKDPLPEGAFIKLQVINRGKHPRPNYRWLLYEDGRWFFARHSGDSSDWQNPFDTNLPSQPNKILDPDTVAKIKTQLKEADFFNQPPYQLNKGVRDGDYRVVTAKDNGKIHEVIYVAIQSPLLAFLQEITVLHEE